MTDRLQSETPEFEQLIPRVPFIRIERVRYWVCRRFWQMLLYFLFVACVSSNPSVCILSPHFCNLFSFLSPTTPNIPSRVQAYADLFVINTFQMCCWGEQMKSHEFDGACGLRESEEECVRTFWWETKFKSLRHMWQDNINMRLKDIG
jgi:hypothetical protein